MPSEVQARAEFSEIRYAQVWEDADVLLEALAPGPGDCCVSIASAGDNALALLARGPARVVALDLNPAQLACLELRVAMYRMLEHQELLILMGSRPEAERNQRLDLFRRCMPLLGDETACFWNARLAQIPEGVGALGKFERYFEVFRTRVVPLIHSKRRVAALLRGGEARRDFYRETWDTWRWRMLFRVFFSRFVMGHLGRDPEFFRYVEGSVSDRILARTRYAFTELDPAENPYLHWIFTGTHGTALPFALRAENFEAIRNHLDRLQLRQGALEDVLDELGEASVDAFNLSDIFEYMSEPAHHALLARIVRAARPGARLAYWNMLAPRSRPESMATQLLARPERSEALLREDKAFFYSAFVLEEVP